MIINNGIMISVITNIIIITIVSVTVIITIFTINTIVVVNYCYSQTHPQNPRRLKTPSFAAEAPPAAFGVVWCRHARAPAVRVSGFLALCFTDWGEGVMNPKT